MPMRRHGDRWLAECMARFAQEVPDVADRGRIMQEYTERIHRALEDVPGSRVYVALRFLGDEILRQAELVQRKLYARQSMETPGT